MMPVVTTSGRPAKWVDRAKRKTKLRDLRVSLLTLHRYRDAMQAFLFFEHLVFGNISHDLDATLTS